MAGIQPGSATGPIGEELASLLRHDLVTPINLIVGYCDLLISEAGDFGNSSRIASLRSIRGCGFALLGEIDQLLMTDGGNRSMVDLQLLGDSLQGPAKTVISTCDLLKSTGSPDQAVMSQEFRDDLSKIRDAGVRMIGLADLLADGQIPRTGQLELPSSE